MLKGPTLLYFEDRKRGTKYQIIFIRQSSIDVVFLVLNRTKTFVFSKYPTQNIFSCLYVKQKSTGCLKMMISEMILCRPIETVCSFLLYLVHLYKGWSVYQRNNFHVPSVHHTLHYDARPINFHSKPIQINFLLKKW